MKGGGTYRVDRTYDWNYAHGPVHEGSLPDVPETPLKSFLGLPVRSRLGIAAGLLLNSNWISFYARLGYDILTYKTVRLRERPCYPLPNWVFVDHDGPLDPSDDRPLATLTEPPATREETTSSVSFGMPSKPRHVWMADVARARKALREGQVLVVSVVASPEPGSPVDAMVDEFAQLASLAREAGAQVIEANLSCPNVCTAEGSVYLAPELCGAIAARIRDAAGSVPVTLKVGHFPDEAVLASLLEHVAGKADGIVMVNGISRRIVRPDGEPAFGAGREVAGVLGHAIHTPCLENLRAARRIISRHRHDVEVIAVGGVLGGDDAARYFDAGAHAVLMGGAPMLLPDLAVQLKRSNPQW